MKMCEKIKQKPVDVNQECYSNGKLLLSGEYAVLDGALALAIPTRFGQSLTIRESANSGINWESLDRDNQIWFHEKFELPDLIPTNRDNPVSQKLSQILLEARKLNPEFLKSSEGLKITAKIDFPREWGLGTSSTLINNIARWAQVNPYRLLEKTFGGSGYDIAAAQHDTPILYALGTGKPCVKPVELNWNFRDRIFFVYLNLKKNSRDAIDHYRKNGLKDSALERISQISEALITCSDLLFFKELINEHEAILSDVLQIPSIQNALFSDFCGSIKSLGGWGGDFIMVTGEAQKMEYFVSKGYKTIFSFDKMIKSRI